MRQMPTSVYKGDSRGAAPLPQRQVSPTPLPPPPPLTLRGEIGSVGESGVRPKMFWGNW